MAFSYWRTGNFNGAWIFRGGANQGGQGTQRNTGWGGYGYQYYTLGSWCRDAFSKSCLRTAPAAAGASPTWNPATSHADYTFSNGNLTATRSVNTGHANAIGNTSHSGTGDWSFTVTLGGSVGSMMVGFANAAHLNNTYPGSDANSISYHSIDGIIYGGAGGSGAAYSTANAITARLKNGKAYWAKDGVWQNSADPVAETGGIDVSSMGALFPVFDTDNARSATADFSGWADAAANNYSLSCATGSFVLTENAAATPAAHVLTASVGTFTLTGNALTLAAGMAAVKGSFVVAGQAASLSTAMPMAMASFILTGASAGFAHGYRLTVTASAFTLSNNAATLIAARRLSAVTGPFSLSGQALALSAGMSALTGVFVLTPQATALAAAIPAATGTFAVAGNAATLKAARLFSGAMGAFALSGNAAALNKVGSSALVADRGTFTLTGPALTLGVAVNLGVASFVITSSTAGLAMARTLTAAAGAFVLTGVAAGLPRDLLVSIAFGSFQLTGNAVATHRQSQISLMSGGFVITGLPARIVSIVLPTPESRRVAGVVVARTAAGAAELRSAAGATLDRTAAGTITDRQAVGNLQPRAAAA